MMKENDTQKPSLQDSIMSELNKRLGDIKSELEKEYSYSNATTFCQHIQKLEDLVSEYKCAEKTFSFLSRTLGNKKDT